MKASQVHSSEPSTAAAANTTEPLLLRLPLELRQNIYAMIFRAPRIVNVSHYLGLDSWTKSQIYRSNTEKRRSLEQLHHAQDVSFKSEKEVGEDGWSHYDEDSDDASGKESRSDDCSRREEDIDNGLGEDWDGYEEDPVNHLIDDDMYEWSTGILEVSKAISDDALDFLYGQRLFVANIHGGGHLKFANFGAANLQRIRYVRLVARPMGITYLKPLEPDDRLCPPLLQGLSEFCMVAQQPLEPRTYYGAPTFEKEMHEWTTWLEPILQYFSIHVSRRTNVSFDADGRLETIALMDKHFAARYEKVRTSSGDLCFERGRYSRESGYWDSDGLDGCNFADGGIGDDWGSD